MPVAIEDLSYTYDRAGGVPVEALRGVDLRIEDGELVGIMGRTGCGKSTLIQLMAGLLRPTGGRVLLDGRDINEKGYDRRLLRESVGVVFQYPEYQLFETTVEKDVAFGLKHSGLCRADVTERVRAALETMGFAFDEIRAQSPLALSGGEKRRVAIAGVLAMRPRILIFDEPVAGLDPRGREAFIAMASGLCRQGATVVIVSHNADALSECAQRLVVLDAGRVAVDAPAGEAFQQLPALGVLPEGISAAQSIAAGLRERGLALPEGIHSYGALLAALREKLGGGERP